ncbi:hypothetical protein SASPL_102903 [Salvia splendens]|uniref:Cupin type-1 domain-containing protein n=1 Tax=Salvia splendens TaxID=180675 RepID=A0A8X9ACK6_SALSN|nr:hypothetical protein SASPL_102903 [Salvia splendens]
MPMLARLVMSSKIDDHLPEKSKCKKEEHVIDLDAMFKQGGSSSVEITSRDSPLVDGGTSDHLCDEGGGRVQIAGLNGARVLDEFVEEGHLVVVPKFFVAVLMATTDEGLECFCVSTSPRRSLYKALSSSVLKVALNVSPDLVKNFKHEI